jgi:hypothetical protein
LIDAIQILMAMTKVAEPEDSQCISVPQAQKNLARLLLDE